MSLENHSNLLTGKRDARIRRANCRAIYVEMAFHAGTWEALEIARRCDVGLPAGTRLPDRFMRRLGADKVPTFNVKLVDQGFAGAQAFHWAHHPLFYLLDRDVVNSKRELAIFYALDSLAGIIRLSFWPAEVTGDAPWTASVAPILDTAKLHAVFNERWLDSLAPLDQLVACVAMGLKAQMLGDDELFFQAAARSQEMFVRSLSTSPHLLAGWRFLAELMRELVWSPANKHVTGSIPIGGVIDSVQAILERDIALQARYPWIWQRLLDDAAPPAYRLRKSKEVPMPPADKEQLKCNTIRRSRQNQGSVQVR